MKFKLVEDFDRGLDETISSAQQSANRTLKSNLKDFDIKPSDYVVHHLSSDVVSEFKGLMDNDLENVLFLPKTPQSDSNAVHQFIHAAANFGGFNNFIAFINSLKSSSASKPIYALRTVDGGERIINAISIDDAVQMTMKGRVN